MLTLPLALDHHCMFRHIYCYIIPVEAREIRADQELSIPLQDFHIRRESRNITPSPRTEAMQRWEPEAFEHAIDVICKPSHQAEGRIRRRPVVCPRALPFWLQAFRAFLMLKKRHKSTSFF